MSVVTSALILTLCIQAANSGAGWEYEGPLGPENWYTQFPTCGGRMQSPINIDTSDVLYDPKLRSFDLRQYSKCANCTMHLENVDGHTAEVKYSGEPIVIRGGSLPNNYVLDQFHFHWGGTNDVGSEHLLNNKAAPLEMHIVHHMEGYDKTASVNTPYGLAVLAFFFKIGERNENFDRLLSHFTNITHKDQSVELEPFTLSDLLPDSALGYYRYYGSLTTPPCSETVIWTLFTEKIEISQEQLDTFRSLKTVREGETEEVPIVNDYRPVQGLHERRVTSNDKDGMNDSVSVLVERLRQEMEQLKKTCGSTNTAASVTVPSLWIVVFVSVFVLGLKLE